MSTGNIVGGVVGAVAGFFVGGPAGALYGFSLGYSVGGLLDPPKGPTVEGPRLSDLSLQTSTYGRFLPRYYGTLAASGNIIWLEGNKLKETVKKKKQGGKGGGGGTTTKTYTYSATFAIALGEGQLAGIKRIWCRDKLLYNSASDDLETIIASNQNASGWRFYPGSDDQLPDPRIEAEKGVGNTPAYRGTAYVVFDDFQLEDYGNTLEGAQFKFEVVGASSDLGASLISTVDATTDREPSVSLSRSEYASGTIMETFSSGSELRVNRVLYGRSTLTTEVAVDGAQYNTPCKTEGYEWARSKFGSGSAITDVGYFNFKTSVGSAARSIVSIDSALAFIGYEYNTNIPRLALCKSEQSETNSNSGILLSTSMPGGRAYIDVTKGGEDTCWLVTFAENNIHFDLYDDELNIIESESYFHDYQGSNPTSQINRQSCTSFVSGSTKYLLVQSGSVFESKLLIMEDGQVNYLTLDRGLGGGTKALSVTSGVLTFVSSFGAVNPDAPLHVFRMTTPSFELVPLADIINAEMELSSLITPADIDTSLITDNVRGYQVSGGSIRSALEPLQGIWPFDVIQSGYMLKCVPRGQTSVVSIPWEHLGANDGDESGDLLKQSREMDTQLPASTHIKYWDVNREYAQGEQYADRPGTSAVNRVDLEVAVVMNADEAAKAVDVLQNLRWLERTAFECSLPPIYLGLEPSDVITVLCKSATYELRIKEKNDTPSGIGQCKLVPNSPSLYTSNAKGAEGVSPPDTIPLSGPTLLGLLDIPLVDEVSQNAPGFVGVATGYTEGWPGALAVRSSDNGQTWDSLQAFTGKATFGLALNTLPVSSGYLIDQRSLTVSLLSGDLEGITLDQLLTGYNYCAYGVNGRWEIVRFQNATLNADGSHTLSGFVRGDKGTEWATGLHQIGDAFVLLDDQDNAFIGAAVQSIGLERLYRGVTKGASLDSASDVPFTYNGVNLEPLSPVDAKATRDVSGNLSATFTRRSRLGSTWWGNGVEAPIGETTQAYEIDVMDGATVVRTIDASTPAFSYSAADQTTDFGSAQASITFRIAQLSETVGQGFVREVTL